MLFEEHFVHQSGGFFEIFQKYLVNQLDKFQLKVEDNLTKSSFKK